MEEFANWDDAAMNNTFQQFFEFMSIIDYVEFTQYVPLLIDIVNTLADEARENDNDTHTEDFLKHLIELKTALYEFCMICSVFDVHASEEKE